MDVIGTGLAPVSRKLTISEERRGPNISPFRELEL